MAGSAVPGNYNNFGDNNRFNANLGNNYNNNGRFGNDSNRFRGICISMKTYHHLFEKISSYDNLLLAFQNAKRGKTKKPYVIEFERNLQNELFRLQWELMTRTYTPRPLTIFTVRDPKTRKISASHFRDRVIHHALINVIGPIFESRFIHDSYANRKGKGTFAAMERFDYFLRKVSGNGKLISREREREGISANANHVVGYALKADIKAYFQSVDHGVLLSIISNRISDEDVLWLIQAILQNHRTQTPGKGMPLGNLTSQFFANAYLHELDIFVKHELGAKYYLRYVDDFVLLSRSRGELEEHQKAIARFLSDRLKLSLHSQKTRILSLCSGLTLLGLRVFYHFRLLKRSNQRRIRKRLEKFGAKLARGEISCERVLSSFAGWEGYAKTADAYSFRTALHRSVERMMTLN